MKFRRTLRFHGLKKPRIRQTWNKYNLFNLATLRLPNNFSRTFFQQKWAAKALSRAYHGEHIKEKKWVRLFSRRLLSVANLRPAYMAKYDGSEQAAGRGSGLEESPSEEEGRDPVKAWSNQSKQASFGAFRNITTTEPTPYMNMAFAPLERRLDIAIFRALFASSARQARQMVVHGKVKVNGIKMNHPSYLLNPGDMFQVDIERVMTATGRIKLQLGKKASEDAGQDASQEEPESVEEADEEELKENKFAEGEVNEGLTKEKQIKQLKTLKERIRFILSDDQHLTIKRKKALRTLVKRVSQEMSKAGSHKKDVQSALAYPQGILWELTQMLDKLDISTGEKDKRDKAISASAPSSVQLSSPGGKESVTPTEDVMASTEATTKSPEAIAAKYEHLSKEERIQFIKLLREERENPYDPSKPYQTPWKPRPYMSAFAFIPPYLEVNQNICAAVYLRHPVARPGSAEVPTPYPPEWNQLAFNWYLRRR